MRRLGSPSEAVLENPMVPGNHSSVMLRICQPVIWFHDYIVFDVYI